MKEEICVLYGPHWKSRKWKESRRETASKRRLTGKSKRLKKITERRIREVNI
jgi:hypothetical protein